MAVFAYSKLKKSWLILTEYLLQTLVSVKKIRRSRANSDERNRLPCPTPAKYGKTQTTLLTTCCVAFLFGFALLVHYYSTSSQRIAQSPHVVDLASQVHSTRIAFGKSPLCGADLHECWTDTAFDDQGWSEVNVPHYDIRNHPDYLRSIDKGWIYYRFHFQLPPDVQNHDGALAFSPFYVLHSKFEAYVKDELAYSGASKSGLASIAVIPLPAKKLRTDQVVVTLKAQLHKFDTGIFHRDSMYVGPREILDDFYLAGERGMVTYYLLFLLTKGSIFIVFALIFLFTKRSESLLYFLIFAFCSTIENFFVSDHFFVRNLSAGIRVLAFFSLRLSGAFALLRYFVSYFDFAAKSRAYWIAVTAAFAVMALACYDFGWGSNSVSMQNLYFFSNSAYLAAVSFGLFGAIYRLAGQRKASTMVAPELKITTGFLFLYFCLIIWDFYFTQFNGFNKLAFFDLVFFYFVAFGVIREFGREERQLIVKTNELAEAKVDQAIARTTKMLAHDIRSPLATIHMVLDMLESEKNKDRIYSVLGRITPIVRQKMKEVDGMIADVLDASSMADLKQNEVFPEKLLETILFEIFGSQRNSKVDLSYQFLHDRLLFADELKIKRVLTNIIQNALQAMGQEGRLWFKTATTTENGKTAIQLTIGNSGSFIDPAAQEQVFDPFYTKGKANGTGLGLAIAKKIVTLHGGRIWCRSLEGVGTEFILVLPTRECKTITPPASLAASSRSFFIEYREFT